MGDATAKMIKDGRRLYLSFGSVRCKALKCNVVFNRYGWNHIIYGNSDHRRNEQDIRRRLHLLPYVVEVIKTATDIKNQEVRTVKKKNERVEATFYEISQFVAKGKQLVTVVIREFKGLEPHYYSLRGRR